jgi:hypothetical protein
MVETTAAYEARNVVHMRRRIAVLAWVAELLVLVDS